MKLYNSEMANSPRKVRMFIAEKNISDIEIINIDLMSGEHKTPEYRAIAPNSRIPALELDDGTVIMESTAICRYLESLYPEPNLFGENAIEIASIEMWQARIYNELMIPLAMAFRHLHPGMSEMEIQNKEYEVKVIKLLDFGAVVEYCEAPGNEVLLHISELAWEKTENVTDVVNLGDTLDVKYFGVDPRTRKEKVSRKALLPKPEGYVDKPRKTFNRNNNRKGFNKK